jgi:hypothetical protein
MRKVLTALNSVKFRITVPKCKFGHTSVKLLGFILSEHGITPDPERLCQVFNIPCATSIRVAALSWHVQLHSTTHSKLHTYCSPVGKTPFQEHPSKFSTQLSRQIYPFKVGELVHVRKDQNWMQNSMDLSRCLESHRQELVIYWIFTERHIIDE